MFPAPGAAARLGRAQAAPRAPLASVALGLLLAVGCALPALSQGTPRLVTFDELPPSQEPAPLVSFAGLVWSGASVVAAQHAGAKAPAAGAVSAPNAAVFQPAAGPAAVEAPGGPGQLFAPFSGMFTFLEDQDDPGRSSVRVELTGFDPAGELAARVDVVLFKSAPYKVDFPSSFRVGIKRLTLVPTGGGRPVISLDDLNAVLPPPPPAGGAPGALQPPPPPIADPAAQAPPQLPAGAPTGAPGAAPAPEPAPSASTPVLAAAPVFAAPLPAAAPVPAQAAAEEAPINATAAAPADAAVPAALPAAAPATPAEAPPAAASPVAATPAEAPPAAASPAPGAASPAAQQSDGAAPAAAAADGAPNGSSAAAGDIGKPAEGQAVMRMETAAVSRPPRGGRAAPAAAPRPAALPLPSPLPSPPPAAEAQPGAAAAPRHEAPPAAATQITAVPAAAAERPPLPPGAVLLDFEDIKTGAEGGAFVSSYSGFDLSGLYALRAEALPEGARAGAASGAVALATLPSRPGAGGGGAALARSDGSAFRPVSLALTQAADARLASDFGLPAPPPSEAARVSVACFDRARALAAGELLLPPGAPARVAFPEACAGATRLEVRPESGAVRLVLDDFAYVPAGGPA
ncbi:hypothetical protein Rsub_12986 [Raphidocelis subcapitata]|uniref:Uncharacterized protein n=1 Tax=Raphidocelis subcapitata TaxID=307507 RepID=A0A2V0PK83_9CHLO|nr:hypothetical protein Rsub_12986 [Raphidocelis subcapitata]|eukprot:GBG00205.1 hypothetical protein Rsub_12986 [Raphidocelis subcapitata]